MCLSLLCTYYKGMICCTLLSTSLYARICLCIYFEGPLKGSCKELHAIPLGGVVGVVHMPLEEVVAGACRHLPITEILWGSVALSKREIVRELHTTLLVEVGYIQNPSLELAKGSLSEAVKVCVCVYTCTFECVYLYIFMHVYVCLCMSTIQVWGTLIMLASFLRCFRGLRLSLQA